VRRKNKVRHFTRRQRNCVELEEIISQPVKHQAQHCLQQPSQAFEKTEVKHCIYSKQLVPELGYDELPNN
jgi:hypothetical protein